MVSPALHCLALLGLAGIPEDLRDEARAMGYKGFLEDAAARSLTTDGSATGKALASFPLLPSCGFIHFRCASAGMVWDGGKGVFYPSSVPGTFGASARKGLVKESQKMGKGEAALMHCNGSKSLLTRTPSPWFGLFPCMDGTPLSVSFSFLAAVSTEVTPGPGAYYDVNKNTMNLGSTANVRVRQNLKREQPSFR